MEGGVGISGEDKISLLPEDLLCKILSFLRTKCAVSTSVLSSRWRNIWLGVPRLDLNAFDFPNYDACVSFVDMFRNGSYLSEFKLTFDQGLRGLNFSPLEPCLSRVLKRSKIQHFEVLNHCKYVIEIPLTHSVCKELVCLRLRMVRLNDFESLYLPCLKIMHLECVMFHSNDAAALLVPCSPVLKELVIRRPLNDLRVCSKSLKSLSLSPLSDLRVCSKSLKSLSLSFFNISHNIEIDAPRLKYLSLKDLHHESIRIINMSALVKVDVDVDFDYLTDDDMLRERNIIYNLLTKVSSVRDMTISWRTLMLINYIRDLKPLPKFHDLSRLHVTMHSHASPELLPFVLESCPTLKYLTLELVIGYQVGKETKLSRVLPLCLVSSLESVDIKSPITGKATELKLVRYFLENSATLKKLVLRLKHYCGEKHNSDLLKPLFEAPRRSSLCQFVVSLSSSQQVLETRAMQGRVGTSGEDRISILPDSLLCHILSFLTTKDSVRTSVLSSRWIDLWLWVPRIDLDKSNFSDVNTTCVGFIDKFLNFRGESYLRGFKLNTDHNVYDTSPLEACLMRVVKCKIQHFEIENYFEHSILLMPLILSMCDTLVSLKLSFVILSDFESLSLPCLKVMHLEKVIFPSDEAAEALVSSSPVLKDLKMSQSRDDAVEVLRVRSTSLKSFTLKRTDRDYVENSGGYTVVIDTPRLEYLNLKDYQCKGFKIVSMSEDVKVDINVVFEVIGGSVLSKRNIICDFLTCVSNVRYMTISRRSLEFIYRHLEMKPQFKFHGLACLRATMFSNSSPEMLPVILETCPNLKHLTLELVHDSLVTEGESGLLTVLPRCLISSLETVDLESPITDKATELKLVSYFLENSTTLKKLVLRLNQSCRDKHEPGLFKQVLESQRCSSLCQLVILRQQ